MNSLIEWLNITPGQDDFAALLVFFWVGVPLIGYCLAQVITWAKE